MTTPFFQLFTRFALIRDQSPDAKHPAKQQFIRQALSWFIMCMMVACFPSKPAACQAI